MWSSAAQSAFETQVRHAALVLARELAAAGTDPAARRAAWDCYGDAQQAAGDAYRAATNGLTS